MSLVAYASSDDSDQEDQLETLSNTVLALKTQNTTNTLASEKSDSAVIEREVEETSDTESRSENEVEHLKQNVETSNEVRPLALAEKEEMLLPLIPPAENSLFGSFDHVIHMPWKGLNDRSHETKKPVKISIPSLLEFADVKPDKKKPKKEIQMLGKASKLFSVLPEPKHKCLKERGRSLVPYTLKKSAKVDVHTKQTKKPKLDDEENDDEDSSTVQDFFSLNVSSHQVTDSWTPDPVPETFAISSEVVESSEETLEPEAPTSSLLNSHVNIEKNLGLDSVAIKRLAGRKANLEEVNFIDINEEAMRPDSNEWLTKQLTVETQAHMHHSHRRNEGPTTQQRRKHQITYLAFQAKEKELELKNQWSQSRMSRKQTQSKYGF